MRLIERRPLIRRYTAAWAALWIGAAFVAMTVFAYTLITFLGGFVALLGVWAFYLLLFCFLAWAVIHAVTHVRRDKAKAYLPGYLGAVTLLCVLVIPSTDAGLDTNFYLNRAQREAVVAQVQTGALKPNVSYNPDLISLPTFYRHLSDGGEIAAIKDGRTLTIYFYTWRGVLDHYSAYIYRSNSTDLTARAAGGTVPFNGDIFSGMRRLDAHWFWGQSS